MSIGAKIKSLRIEKGLTQKQLGDLCGMADSAIRRYESERGNPTKKTIQRIADALGVSVAYLLGWDEAMEALEAAGMSVEDIAKEMNIPEDRIMKIVNSQDIYSPEAASKIIRVAFLLANEAKKSDSNSNFQHPDYAGQPQTFQPFTKTDDEFLRLGGFGALAEFYKLPEDAQKEAMKDIHGFVEYTIAKYKKQATQEDQEDK